MIATVNHGRFARRLIISSGISFLLIAASVLFLIAALPAADDPLGSLLARARVAGNYDHARPCSIHTRGTMELDGFSGTFESWHDLADGRYEEIIKAGPLSRARGFDGSKGWYEDAKGIVLPRSAPFGLAAICDYRFLLTGQLFQPNYGGAEVSYLGRRSERGKSYEALTVKPKGGNQMEWWFDGTSGLLARKIERSAGRTTVTSYSNYDDVGGAMIPGHETSAVDGHVFEAFTLSEFDANPTDIERHLSMPASEPNDYFISGGETHIPLQLIEHFQLIDSLDVKVLINGKGPFHFMFDTGADNVISPDLAGELAIKLLKPNVPSQLRGNALKIRYAQIDNVQLGGATLANQYFKIIQPLQYSQRHKIQGLIGYEFLARFEATIDYAHSQLILRMPARLSSESSSEPKGFPIHILFDNTRAVIPCALSGVPANCSIDTGAALGVIVTKQFGDTHPGILSDIFATDYLYGIGDRARTRFGMLDSVEIGGTTIPHEVTGFSIASHGSLAGTHYFDALIGNPVLRDFKVTFDYPNETLYLTPNANIGSQ